MIFNQHNQTQIKSFSLDTLDEVESWYRSGNIALIHGDLENKSVLVGELILHGIPFHGVTEKPGLCRPISHVYAIDLDNTLTNGEAFWHNPPTPRLERIKVLQTLIKMNAVIIWTARGWTYYDETIAWLDKHNVPRDGIYMQKGGADIYVDDKAMLDTAFFSHV